MIGENKFSLLRVADGDAAHRGIGAIGADHDAGANRVLAIAVRPIANKRDTVVVALEGEECAGAARSAALDGPFTQEFIEDFTIDHAHKTVADRHVDLDA